MCGYPVIVHIPHSSTVIPRFAVSQFAHSSTDLNRELLLMTDRYTELPSEEEQ